MLVMLILIWSTDGSNDNVILVVSFHVLKLKSLASWNLTQVFNIQMLSIFSMYSYQIMYVPS